MTEDKNTHKPKIVPVPREQQTQDYWTLLNNVIDPEVGFGIVDLGLIYTVEIKDGTATVIMTLTSMGCPAGPDIMRRIEAEMGRYPGIQDVKVELVWTPVWGQNRINPDIRSMLL